MAPQHSYHQNGRFTRPDSIFRNFISREPGAQFPPEAGRYALYLSPLCPWAHRTLIVRHLKGLESVIDLYQLHTVMGPQGWYFSGENGSLASDPLHGFTEIKDLYLKADPGYTGRYTVPVLWDKKTDTVVNNESSEIIRMFYTEFDDLIPEKLREINHPAGGFYPKALRGEIDALNSWVYDTVNNGVYKSGFATAQESYEENVQKLFSSLDRLEEQLSHGKKYLLGDSLTDADIRLYTTLARFDVAYHSVFMCNLKMIRHDYPLLHAWLRRLYWDSDESGEFRGAFYRTTEPWIAQYAYGYAHSRWKIVNEESGSLVVPLGPAIKMLPL